VQNYFPSPRSHTWSLAVEEHFYLALPILLFLLLRWRPGALSSPFLFPCIVLGVSLVGLTIRLLIPVHAGEYYEKTMWTHFQPTHTRAGSLFFGVFLAYLHYFRPGCLAWVPKYRLVLLFVAAALLLPLGRHELGESPWVFTFGLTMAYVG